jgi:hypothetical protein
MLSRALATATVMLLIGGFASIPVRAENLEAGKSPSQIFAGACSECHKGARGLIKTVTPGSLPGFLRQHYTTSSDMAGLLSAYLLSNGAADARPGASSTKQGRDAKSEPKSSETKSSEAKSEPGSDVAPDQSERRRGRRHPAAAPQEAAKPDADVPAGQREPEGEPSARHSRHAKRLAKPDQDVPEAEKPAADAQPATAASGTGPDGRPLKGKGRHKLSKRGRPGREAPPQNETTKDETPKGETAGTETPKDALSKDDAAKTDVAKPDDEAKADAAKAEAMKAEGIKLLRDPVPAVTPAAKPAEAEPNSAQTAEPAPTASITPAPSASMNPSERSAASAPAARPMEPATDDSTPPPTQVPAAPPVPPISR